MLHVQLFAFRGLLRWLPGLLLALALTSSLVALRGARPAAPTHAAVTGTPIPVAAPAHEHAAWFQGSVAEQLAAHTADVAFCASASLEPFDGALAQLRTGGPEQATERMRFCLIETLFGHTDATVAADLDTHIPHINECYRQLLLLSAPGKEGAVRMVATCMVAQAATQ